MIQSKNNDVFISYASEDKELFVRPLALALGQLGLSVWFDELSLHPGDSLSASIDKGISESRFGLLVISPNFFKKHWPVKEYRALLAREQVEGRVVIPIWHGVSLRDVIASSPILADKIAIRTEEQSAEDVAIQILREVRPDLYEGHERSELELIASGTALRDLQVELNRVQQDLDETQESLSEYRCPFCESQLVIRIDAPADSSQDHWGIREEFECGFVNFGGIVERPCPADPDFPRWEDFDLQHELDESESRFRWSCRPIGKTAMARSLHLRVGYGRTKGEAEAEVREQYKQTANRSQ